MLFAYIATVYHGVKLHKRIMIIDRCDAEIFFKLRLDI